MFLFLFDEKRDKVAHFGDELGRAQFNRITNGGEHIKTDVDYFEVDCDEMQILYLALKNGISAIETANFIKELKGENDHEQ